MTHRYDPNRHHRRSIRLRGYDYTRSGAYFLTVVTQDRLCLFGDVTDEGMSLNDAGKMVRSVWDRIPDRFPSIELDEFAVMPNHVHGIVVIHKSPVGASLVGAPGDGGNAGSIDRQRENARVAPALGDVVGAYKSLTTVEYARRVDEDRWEPFNGRLWQRNYYEHVIRNDEEWNRVREYVLCNPMRWETDTENLNASSGTTLAGAVRELPLCRNPHDHLPAGKAGEGEANSQP